MRRRDALAVSLAFLLSPPLAACQPAGGAGSAPMTVHGLDVRRIGPDHRVRLAGGLEIAGDERLAAALAAGGAGIREVTVLERFPPVYVVTYDDGETVRYQSRRADP